MKTMLNLPYIIHIMSSILSAIHIQSDEITVETIAETIAECVRLSQMPKRLLPMKTWLIAVVNGSLDEGERVRICGNHHQSFFPYRISAKSLTII